MSLLAPDAPPLLLASGSAARLALLRGAGLDVQAHPAAVDEAAVKAAGCAERAPAGEIALLLAEMKAARVARRFPDALVIGADQLLVCGGAWFDKPSDHAAARAELLALRGREHVLETAVVVVRHGARVWHHLARPRLTMRAFGEAFLDAYLAAEDDALLSAIGAYRLEGLGAHLFERVDGDHAAILGLPLLPLLSFLRQSGVLRD